MVSRGLSFASLAMLQFRHPDSFIAGNLSTGHHPWQGILWDYPGKTFVLPIIYEGVKGSVFRSFQRHVRKRYNCKLLPRIIIPNSPSCFPFQKFITNTIMERVVNGSLNVIWRVGAVDALHLVMPITMKASKRRMVTRSVSWIAGIRTVHFP